MSSYSGFLMYTIFAPVHPVLSKQNAPRRHSYGRHLWGGAFNYERTTDPNGIRIVNLTSPSFEQGNGDSHTCIYLQTANFSWAVFDYL